MIKYAKIEDPQTGICIVANGRNEDFYRSIGMSKLEVSQSDIDGQWYLTKKCPMKTEEQKIKEERERLDNLSLTKREVFLALYENKGITPEQLKNKITDTQALIEFEYATDYFRGNPLVNTIGKMLGYTSSQLDYLFRNKKFPKEVLNDN